MRFEIAPLPYAVDALAPTLSAATLEVHYEKHHKGYLEKLREATEGKPEASFSLEALIQSATGDVLNNAAQVWNHSFYWRCMRPRGGGKPRGALLGKLETAFGSFDAFRSEFAEAANLAFGSGWVWLVQDELGKLRITTSANAGNPLQQGARPLLTLDVWEHAYYLDYRNERARYVEGFLEQLVNWEFVAANLDAASNTAPSDANPRLEAGERNRAEAAAVLAGSGCVPAAARSASRGEGR